MEHDTQHDSWFRDRVIGLLLLLIHCVDLYRLVGLWRCESSSVSYTDFTVQQTYPLNINLTPMTNECIALYGVVHFLVCEGTSQPTHLTRKICKQIHVR